MSNIQSTITDAFDNMAEITPRNVDTITKYAVL